VGESAGFGSGGPNQEVALGAALKLDPTDRVAGVWLDTDGSDGGTEFAGAIADGLTRSRAIESHLDLKKALFSHQAGYALAKLEDLVVTGPTQTNVNDIFVIVVA
jgi:glycerate-2-kinase